MSVFLQVILSGIVCFFLRRNWFMHLPSIAKIPIYALLGTSVAFSLTFTLVDIVNILIGVFQSSVAKPLVQSIGQVSSSAIRNPLGYVLCASRFVT